MEYSAAEGQLFSEQPNQGRSIVRDGIGDVDAYVSAPTKVAFVVNQPNSENLVDLRSIISTGQIKHPYDTLAHFVHTVGPWPSHAHTFAVASRAPLDKSYSFDSVALINMFKGHGFWLDRINLEQQKAHPYSRLLVDQVRLYEPKLVICFGVEPFSLLIEALGPCEWDDPVQHAEVSPYISWMTERNRVIANFGYFAENDPRIEEMYEGFIRLLRWATTPT